MIKDIIITIIAAQAVIEGKMTLGMMMAVQYMAAQLNAPLQQFIAFIRSAQDAKISTERLAEIHQQPNEDAFIQNSIGLEQLEIWRNDIPILAGLRGGEQNHPPNFKLLNRDPILSQSIIQRYFFICSRRSFSNN